MCSMPRRFWICRLPKNYGRKQQKESLSSSSDDNSRSSTESNMGSGLRERWSPSRWAPPSLPSAALRLSSCTWGLAHLFLVAIYIKYSLSILLPRSRGWQEELKRWKFTQVKYSLRREYISNTHFPSCSPRSRGWQEELKRFDSSIERVLCPLLLMKRTLIQLVLESDSRLSCVSQVLDLTCRPSYRCSKWQLKSDLHMLWPSLPSFAEQQNV